MLQKNDPLCLFFCHENAYWVSCKNIGIHMKAYQDVMGHNAVSKCITKTVRLFGKHKCLRCQLRVVHQVLQWIAAAEFIQQSRQIADDSRRVRCVNVPWYIPNLHQWKVPICIGPLSCGHLQTHTHTSAAAAACLASRCCVPDNINLLPPQRTLCTTQH